MDVALTKDDVIPQRWREYEKTPEFKQGQRYAIPAHDKRIENQERLGLKHIYSHFINELVSSRNIRSEFIKRTPADWLLEWKQMHTWLFKNILRECGEWRKKDIRFGDPGDEELHQIPSYQLVSYEVGVLASQLCDLLQRKHNTIDERLRTLAIVHYKFIRVHPFPDGNGRIARALTDQLANFFGFPMAMGGYPRHNPGRRKDYHQAIRACAFDPDCNELSVWIRSYIERQIEDLA